MHARVSPPFRPEPPRRGLEGDRGVRDPALAYVQTPPSLRVAAGLIAALFVALSLMLLVVPWQQAAVGSGRVIAYAPAEREQLVQAPVDGRLSEWLVNEGDVVELGQPLVQLLDNDPNLVQRLEQQRTSLEDERAATSTQLLRYGAKASALEANIELVIAEYDSKIAELQQKRVGDVAELETAQLNQSRHTVLASEGISSSRKRELADLKARSAKAKLEARDQEIAATRRARDKATRDAESKLASAQAEVEAARTKLAQVDRKLLELDSKLSQQAAQLVTAPRAGTILRLHGGAGGGQVKKGEQLVTIVPSTQSRAAQLYVDGNDMPFVKPGSHVRLVFEGWPALQVVGLPGNNPGTFGGKVAFVDASDDGTGKFRVLIQPDPASPPWPEPDVLRQGVRVKGWVMLGKVRLGYELWRQLNGFPPIPTVEKGEEPMLPSTKKNRAPSALK